MPWTSMLDTDGPSLWGGDVGLAVELKFGGGVTSGEGSSPERFQYKKYNSY